MITTTVRIDWGEDLEDKVLAAVEKAQVVLDEQVLKDSNYFIPKDTGNIEDSSIINSRIGEGELVWSTEYARKIYFGVDMHFQTDQNPNARALWFEEAKSRWTANWVQLANREVKDNL